MSSLKNGRRINIIMTPLMFGNYPLFFLNGAILFRF
nr:MAG TPA: hypothetical protein [Caudoviricetes sp.]